MVSNGLKDRQAAVFICGVALGAAAVTWFALSLGADPAPAARPAADKPVATLVSATAPPEGTRCEFEPVIPVAGDEDGSQRMPADLSGRTAAQIRPLLVTGKENAASGRPRDAEIAFLSACRVARALGDAGRAAYADAKYQLGRHYALVARAGTSSPAEHAELLQRARVLYTDALAALRAQHGDAHEKTRFAAQGLASLEQAVAGAGPGEADAGPAPAEKAAPAIVRAPPLPEPPAKTQPAPRRAVAAVSTSARVPPARREPVAPEAAAVPVESVEPVEPVGRRAPPPPRVAERSTPPAPPRIEVQQPQPALVEEPPGAATGSAGTTE